MDLRVIDTVPAHSLEIGDMVSIAGCAVEILGIDEPSCVSLLGFNLDTGDTETYEFDPDQMIDILGV